jgi:hypothetical protein
VIYTKKNEFIENMCQSIQAQKARGYPVLITRQDIARESNSLEKRLQSADWKLQAKIDYIAADTPQQDALAELKCTYFSAKARAAMHDAGVPRERRWEFSPEVILTMTKLDWLKLVTINWVRKTRMEHCNLPIPRFAKYLHTLGEAETVKTGMDRKAGDRGVCLWDMPPITRVTAKRYGIQILSWVLRLVTRCFLIRCSSRLQLIPRECTRNKKTKPGGHRNRES